MQLSASTRDPTNPSRSKRQHSRSSLTYCVFCSPSTSAKMRTTGIIPAMPNTLLASTSTITQITVTKTVFAGASAAADAVMADALEAVAKQTNSTSPIFFTELAGHITHITSKAFDPSWLGTLPKSMEPHISTIQWVSAALAFGAGTGALGYFLGRRHKDESLAPPIPIPPDEDAASWRNKTRLFGFLCLKAAKKIRQLKEMVDELRHHADLLQTAVNSETMRREKSEINLKRLRDTPSRASEQDDTLQDSRPSKLRSSPTHFAGSSRPVGTSTPPGRSSEPRRRPKKRVSFPEANAASSPTLLSRKSSSDVASSSPSPESGTPRSPTSGQRRAARLLSYPRTPGRKAYTEIYGRLVESGVEEVAKGTMTRPELVESIDRQVRDYKRGENGTPTSAKAFGKRKAVEEASDGAGGPSAKALGKRKAVEEDAIEEHVESEEELTTPEANRMDLEWRKKHTTTNSHTMKKFDLASIPKLVHNPKRPTKRARQNDDPDTATSMGPVVPPNSLRKLLNTRGSSVGTTPTAPRTRRNTRSGSVSSTIESAIAPEPRRSPRKLQQRNLNIKQMSKKSAERSATPIDEEDET
ncbi:hypothetical protein BDV95DRAFT_20492 [Massariosphaeria phaeospora]|uniref:Uncharacterized protein n=1 Tax=Massariosphaeria phaeospora TaxID=100035 RepID=A0A7C8MPH7_9PLEO|nr:hypothetical protein BDV95DRAFT_20492 [Massariosphaeria phaeospora]